MISRSYAEALSALKHKSIKGENAIIHIDEVAQNQPENYVYTLETETRLLNFIKTGDAQAAISLIDDIIGSAAEGNFSSADMDNTFVLLASTILRAAYDTGCAEPVRDVFTSLHRSSGAGPMAECIHAHVAALINAINEKRTGQNRHIFDQMILYIEEHYAQDISLNILKDQVGYSGSYLSHIFKQVSGENFVDYLNRYRILRAKELLAKTRLSIAQISQQCGFTTSNNFIRVYKKYEGVTPGQFRRNSGG